MTQALVVMGVAGCGKSTVGRALARELGFEFVEGDDLHSQHNIERMANGHPLDDADRWEWLAAIAERIAKAKRAGLSLVVACSALKRAYRDILRMGDSAVLFVHLAGPKDFMAERLARRAEHFMPVSLIDSQFATLEAPAASEHALVFDAALPVTDIVTAITIALGEQESANV